MPVDRKNQKSGDTDQELPPTPCDLHSQGVILVRQFVEQGNGGRRPGDGFCETDVDQSNGRARTR